MARDRKRAKQRRDRTRRSPGAAPQRTARRREDEGQGVVPAASPDGISRAEQESTLDPPEATENASAEVDLAHAQIASGRPRPEDDADDDGEIYPDELGPADSSDDELQDSKGTAIGARRGGETTDRSGAPLDRSQNRVAAFLQASMRELQRVQWPDRRQVTQATGVVLAFVVVAGFFLALCDLVFNRLVDALL